MLEKNKLKIFLDLTLLFIHLLIVPVIFDSFFGHHQWYRPFTYIVILVCSIVSVLLINLLKSHLSSMHFGYLCQSLAINLFIAISLIVLKYIGETRTFIVIGLSGICLVLLIYSFVLDYRLSKVISN